MLALNNSGAGALVCAIALVLALLDRWGLRVLRWLPAYALAYLVPMAFLALGVLPGEASSYGLLRRWALPSALFILLASIDLRALFRLGPRVALLYLLSILAVTLAGPLAFFCLHSLGFFEASVLPTDLFASLCASWVGGSINFATLADLLAVPEGLIAQVLVVDLILSGGWMFAMLTLPVWVPTLRSNTAQWWIRRSRERGEHSTQEPTSAPIAKQKNARLRGFENGFHWETWRIPELAGLVGVALLTVATVATTLSVAAWLPRPEGLSATVWVVVLVSVLGSLVSLTRLRASLRSPGASMLANVFLFTVLATMGARAGLSSANLDAEILLLGALWLVFQGAMTVLAAKFLRLPLGFAAVASQANIGGVVSAPLVGALYAPELAALGALLGAGGYVLGTYAALLCRYWFTFAEAY